MNSLLVFSQKVQVLFNNRCEIFGKKLNSSESDPFRNLFQNHFEEVVRISFIGDFHGIQDIKTLI